MATITTDTYLDTATGARTAGETWTVTGCTFTVRTDTRVYNGAPASMTGSLGTVSVDTGKGGTIVLDGTKVRWMAFDTGTGNVPAIGTMITQGGVSGYLLGVWTDCNVPPTAPAAAMPATGFLKFREVTGGSFVTGALTGISANASSPDVTGWIEVCMDQSATLTGYDLGGGVQVKGDWFYLGTATGVYGQTLNTPSNSNASTSHVFGVQIETTPGSGVYEWWPTASPTAGAANWSSANIAMDVRAKIVKTLGGSQIMIGEPTAPQCGYVPAAGCKIRMPNVLGRTVATAARATNGLPGAVTRANVNGAKYDFNGFHGDFTFSGVNVLTLSLKNYTSDVAHSFTNNRDSIVIDNVCIGGFTSAAASILSLSNINGGTVNAAKSINTGSISGTLTLAAVSNVAFTNIEAIIAKTRTATAYSISATGLYNCTFTNIKVKGGNFQNSSASNVTYTNLDYIDRLEGPTTTALPSNLISFTASSNCKVDGITFGERGLLANTQSYNAILTCSGSGSSNIKLRNVGTRTNPLNCGSSATLYPASIVSSGSNDSNISVQRVFASGTRTSLVTGGYTAQTGVLYEDVGVTSYSVNAPSAVGRNAIYRKVIGTPSPSLPGSTVGVHWVDNFTSDTAGSIRWIATTPSPETAATTYLDVTANQGTGFIPSSPAVSLDTLNDALYSESQWKFLGHTGFQNVAPVMIGSAVGTVIYYDLDTGSGYRGTWKLANGANLSSEVVSPTGFKMKIKVLQTTSGTTTSQVQAVTFATTSTLNDQANNQYPLDTNTLAFTGLVPGSEVRCYVGTDPATAVEIGGTEGTSGSTFSFTHSAGGQDGYIMIASLNYKDEYIPYTFKSVDESLLIRQIPDRNYNNPV